MAHDSKTDDPRVTTMDETEGGFWVQSRTRNSLSHAVNVPNATCTCEAGQHGIECWHLDFCRAVYYWHRYDKRAALWRARAQQVDAVRTRTPRTQRPAGLAALQELFPEPVRS